MTITRTADVRNGQASLHDVYNAVVRSPAWSRTVLVITYDEWSGFACLPTVRDKWLTLLEQAIPDGWGF